MAKYGMFNSYEDYEKALDAWYDKAAENNKKFFEDFKGDLFDAVSSVFAEYHMHHGCRYRKEDAVDALAKFFENPDPWELQDMIDMDEKDESMNDPMFSHLEERAEYSEKIRELMSER